jgi:hypothetical protein
MPKPELLAALPTIDRTRELTRALAVLDTMMSEEWDSRYFSFDPAWSEGEQMGSMRNGSGDDWYCWFGAAGAAIVGFDHESDMSPYHEDPPELWPGLIEPVPEAFREPVLEEAAFEISDSTFVIWRESGDDSWYAADIDLPDGEDPDGAEALLEPLVADDPVQWYVDFAADYYEEEVDAEAVAAIFRGEPLTAALVTRLNPDRDAAAALAEAADMGYPTA